MDANSGSESIKFVISDFDKELFTVDDSNEDRYTNQIAEMMIRIKTTQCLSRIYNHSII